MQADTKQFEPPLCFVLNGGSGRRDADAARDAIESAMRAAARRYHLFIIEDIDDLTATIQQAVDAAESENGAVVAVGGDGTINAVATAALGRRCCFGAIPQGTFNYFGRSLGIPEDIDAALQDLLHGQVTPVQVGLVNDRVFLVNASVGLYPQLLEDREAFKQRYGRSRFVALWSALVTACGDHRYLNLVLEQGSEQSELRTTTLFIGNNRLQLEQVGVEQAESVTQGQLAAIAVKPVGTLAMLWLAARGALGKLGEAENVTGFSFRSLSVSPRGLLRGNKHRKHRIKVAVDGEVMWLDTPLAFRVAPEPLQLIRQKTNDDTPHAFADNHKDVAA
ncbi:diacylglycerol/lipid kinase family protein [Allopusillimonas ginsengisoli]|uniref:diacylglycerol/lipid kinase family protein n=1 Tax=Allopusillimonas ginsengisoli TaxID=453575 RepID=UPI001021DA55|nr:diacylglycerol kinase family protein [Allopusillimonas ginsengisoli]TEA79907.1 diacylglycerol kinase [Allopusillimonas ginsengisoli]